MAEIGSQLCVPVDRGVAEKAMRVKPAIVRSADPRRVDELPRLHLRQFRVDDPFHARDAALEQYTILTNIDPDWAEKLNGLINP